MLKSRNNIGQSVKIGAAAVALALLGGVASALAGYSNGNEYTRSSQSYQYGYAAGAVDMLAALQQTKLLKPGAFDNDAAKVIQCIEAKKMKPSQIRAVYLKYLETNPKQKADNAAPNIVAVLKAECKV
jgi:hypothetical protein